LSAAFGHLGCVEVRQSHPVRAGPDLQVQAVSVHDVAHDPAERLSARRQLAGKSGEGKRQHGAGQQQSHGRELRMSGAIGPGDFVECVDASVAPEAVRLGYTGCALQLGAVYVVDRVGVGSETGLPSVWLRGHHRPCADGSYLARRFRPIYRPNSEILNSLLRDVPAKERA
jgi:hypothetical protein